MRQLLRNFRLILTGKLKSTVTKLVMIRRAKQVREFKEKNTLKNRMSQL
jgi:hypothetical protein